MKSFNIKIIYICIGVAVLLTACAKDSSDSGSGGFETDTKYEYLEKYDALKTYIDRTAHPLFKAGVAVGASEYDNHATIYEIANANFDEIVAGNAMKMASCVNSSGTMDFTLPAAFVGVATRAGMTVYGHCLAWHSQQPVTWLNRLVALSSTDKQKKDTLVWAMNTWASGMMKATGYKIKAWDLVNEPLSGADSDDDGRYDLQHSTKKSDGTWDVGGTSFYWQDYLGDEDYPVIVSDAARKAITEGGEEENEFKFFINDYNLESTWDNNKKLESLIQWINIWKTRGAKIDGIGTQMHISYYIDETSQKNQELAITRMFQLMAQTGLLCRISELDMGIYDKQFGNKITTSNVTFAQEKAMANYYQWIIEQFMTIIPQAQQYGITQWCATDSPTDSYWRAGEPVGLWTVSYKRKPTFGGWAEGLKK